MKHSDFIRTVDKRLRIDAHTHLAGIDQKNHNCFISEKMRNSLAFKYYVHSLNLGVTAKVVKDRTIQGTDFPIPSIPMWPIAIGTIKALKLQFVDNLFDKDYLAKKAAGFPEEHFLRGHDVFLGNV